jgi:hypothetical protein
MDKVQKTDTSNLALSSKTFRDEQLTVALRIVKCSLNMTALAATKVTGKRKCLGFCLYHTVKSKTKSVMRTDLRRVMLHMQPDFCFRSSKEGKASVWERCPPHIITTLSLPVLEMARRDCQNNVLRVSERILPVAWNCSFATVYSTKD